MDDVKKEYRIEYKSLNEGQGGEVCNDETLLSGSPHGGDYFTGWNENGVRRAEDWNKNAKGIYEDMKNNEYSY